MTKLTSETLRELMGNCLAGDTTEDNIQIVEGIGAKYCFDIRKMSVRRDQIKSLLAELPDEFRSKRGGGWSFLQACNDRHGVQWTGLHQEMEALFCLGIATGDAQWLLPRDTWSVLPGGMPYVSVL